MYRPRRPFIRRRFAGPRRRGAGCLGGCLAIAVLAVLAGAFGGLLGVGTCAGFATHAEHRGH